MEAIAFAARHMGARLFLRYMEMTNFFESPFKGITLDKQVSHPNIRVGRFSYYSGYYHGHSFDDCARFILPDGDADKLIIGSFCSIGSGAAFIMAGNQGHRHDWISTFPFYWMPDVRAFEGARNGFQPAGDTVVGNDVWIGSEAIVMPGVRICRSWMSRTPASARRRALFDRWRQPRRADPDAVRCGAHRLAARDAVVGLE